MHLTFPHLVSGPRQAWAFFRSALLIFVPFGTLDDRKLPAEFVFSLAPIRSSAFCCFNINKNLCLCGSILRQSGIPVLATLSEPVYAPPPPDGAMQLLKVARGRPGAASSSQPDKKGEFSSGFVDTSPCLLTIPLISFATSSARYPVGSGSASIRRTMLANSRLVMWLSANSSQ